MDGRSARAWPSSRRACSHQACQLRERVVVRTHTRMILARSSTRGRGSLWPSSRSSASPPPAPAPPPPCCPDKCLLNVALRSATRPTLICSATHIDRSARSLSKTCCLVHVTHLATGKLEVVHLLDRSHRILMPLEPAHGRVQVVVSLGGDSKDARREKPFEKGGTHLTKQ